MHLSSILHYRAGPEVMVYKLPIAMHELVVTNILQPTITLMSLVCFHYSFLFSEEL